MDEKTVDATSSLTDEVVIPPPATTTTTAEEAAVVEHPPHVHRLLRLVREGTPSHASRASSLLGRYASSCCRRRRVGGGGDGGSSLRSSSPNSMPAPAPSAAASGQLRWGQREFRGYGRNS